MTDEYEHPSETLERERTLRAAETLKTINKISDDIASFDVVASALDYSLLDANANNPRDLRDMMVLQTHILDGFFHKLARKAHEETDLRVIDRALFTQNQVVRTLMAWREMNTEYRVKYKLIKKFAAYEEDAERTEQNHSWPGLEDGAEDYYFDEELIEAEAQRILKNAPLDE
jgi:hypothetical protein